MKLRFGRRRGPRAQERYCTVCEQWKARSEFIGRRSICCVCVASSMFRPTSLAEADGLECRKWS